MTCLLFSMTSDLVFIFVRYKTMQTVHLQLHCIESKLGAGEEDLILVFEHSEYVTKIFSFK